MSRQTVLITGASSGIGRSLAELFARDGYDVVLVARRAAELQEQARDLADRHRVVARAIPADLAKAEGAPFLYTQLQRIGIDVDVLVNNAGVGMQGAFAELPLDRQLQMIHLNATALTTLTRLLIPGMLARRRGGILNVGSTAGFQPGPFMAVYYATKAYVVSFTEAIAEELDGSGLRVTCLAPGPTATGFAAEAGATQSRLFSGDTMTADDVAAIGYEAWKEGRPLVIAGSRNRFSALVVRLAPRAMVRKIVRRLNTGGNP
jgi:short-subunit dehydrogenase